MSMTESNRSMKPTSDTENRVATLQFKDLTKLPEFRRRQMADWLREKADEIEGDVSPYDDRFRATFNIPMAEYNG
jgi:hypothetical protein